MELFAKAMEYAENASVLNGGYRFPVSLENVAEYRLHTQAVKILKMAISRAKDDGFEERSAGFQASVCGYVRAFEERYAKNWKLEGNWYYKDFEDHDEFTNTLIFLRELGVHWKQLDNTLLGSAMHLRISANDYGVIYNPAEFAVEPDKSRKLC